MEQNTKQLAVEKIKASANVLITVSSNPSVDDLTAAIGFSLLIDKLGKHASAVFSGEIPPAIQFLEPNKRLDKDVGSLRDFIIALDKSKADKLRYKVDGDVVRIFITPYKSIITQDDLTFSQGDFNIDAVVALGVKRREDIDAAIKAHGRILHDAAVITINAGPDTSDLGTINWQDPTASSLCEMLVSISESFGSGLLDEQISTAFLTGIVAETERFSNPKTSPKVMTMSAQLMAAGANQQLIAANLIDTSKLSLLGGAKEVVPDELELSQIKINHDGQIVTDSQNQLGSTDAQPLPAPLPSPQVPSPIDIPPPPPEVPSLNIEAPSPKSLSDVKDEITNLVQKPPQVSQRKAELVLPPLNKPVSQDSDGLIEDSFSSPDPGYNGIGAISRSKGRGPRDIDDSDPLLGGTFNATSKTAHEENIDEQKNSINRKLLTHSEGSASDQQEDEVKPVYKAADVQPYTAPVQPTPDVIVPTTFMSAPTPDQNPPPPPQESLSQFMPAPSQAPPPSLSADQPQVAANNGPSINIDEARKAVEQAMLDQPFDPSHHPIQSIGSQSLTGGEVPNLSGEIGIDQNGNLSNDDSHSFPMPPQV